MRSPINSYEQFVREHLPYFLLIMVAHLLGWAVVALGSELEIDILFGIGALAVLISGILLLPYILAAAALIAIIGLAGFVVFGALVSLLGELIGPMLAIVLGIVIVVILVCYTFSFWQSHRNRPETAQRTGTNRLQGWLQQLRRFQTIAPHPNHPPRLVIDRPPIPITLTRSTRQSARRCRACGTTIEIAMPGCPEPDCESYFGATS